jgi:hypothetical protein
MIIHIEDITTQLDIVIKSIIIIIQTEVDQMFLMQMVEEISINQEAEIITKLENLRSTKIISLTEEILL